MAGNPSTHRSRVQSQQETFLGGFVPGLSGNGAGFGLNRTFASSRVVVTLILRWSYLPLRITSTKIAHQVDKDIEEKEKGGEVQAARISCGFQ